MAYSLSFADSFYYGEDIDNIEPSERPTSVMQAIESLTLEEKIVIARECLKSEAPEIKATTEMFASNVLALIRETDTCSNLDSPVSVWIDAEGWHTLDVYDTVSDNDDED